MPLRQGLCPLQTSKPQRCFLLAPLPPSDRPALPEASRLPPAAAEAPAEDTRERQGCSWALIPSQGRTHHLAPAAGASQGS